LVYSNNDEGISSEPDIVIIIVKPDSIPSQQPPNEEPKTIGDLIKSIIENPSDITNSVYPTNKIRDIITDDNRENHKLVCELLYSGDYYLDGIQEILGC
jgi:hypothetical protein